MYRFHCLLRIIISIAGLRIGFEFPLYEFAEPSSLTAFTDRVFLIKEDNRRSERTFDVTITVSNPPGAVLPATLQNTDPAADFDYSIGGAGVATTSIRFLPEASRLAFSFELNGDNLTEGLEGFLAASSSTPGFPLFQPPLLAFSDTVIRILDDDSEFMIVPNLADRPKGKAWLRCVLCFGFNVQ